MDLNALIDRLVPGPDGSFDHASATAQGAVLRAVDTPAGERVWTALHGNEWFGHPIHPVVVTVPIGAWCVSAWHDVRSAGSGDPRDEHAADAALRVGVAAAVVAALTGVAQFADTRGAVRRETSLHAALNATALGLYLASWAARKKGRRPLGRRLSSIALGIVGVSGYLGGDISYRHGVGVRPQALRHVKSPAADTSDAPLVAGDAVHV